MEINQKGGVLTKPVITYKHYDEVNKCLIVRVKGIDRNRSAEEALNATSVHLHLHVDVDDGIIDHFPKGEGDEAEIIFRNYGCLLSNQELEEKYEANCEIPVDLITLCAVNGADNTFRDKYPNGTLLKDYYGKRWHATFKHWLVAGVNKGGQWGGFWWFGGIRKKTSVSEASAS